MRLFIIVYFLTAAVWATAQSTQNWTEEEITIQSALIEASAAYILNNPEKAIEKYNAALQKNKQLDIAWYQLSRIYSDLEDYPEALQSIDKAILLSPDQKWYQLQKVDILQLSGEDLDARTSLEAYVNRTPDVSPAIRERLAFLYLKTSDPAEAITRLDALEADVGVREDYTLRKYKMYRQLEDNAAAARELERYLSFYPSDINMWQRLADHEIDMGRDAAEVYATILELDPSNTKAALGLASTGSTSEKYPEAGELDAILSDSRASIDDKIQRALIGPLTQLADAYDDQLSQQLIRSGELLVEAHPKDAKSHALLGDILFHSGLYHAAYQSYRASLDITQSILPVWENALISLDYIQDYTRMGDLADRALMIFPNQASTSYYELLAAARSGDPSRALGGMRRAELLSQRDGYYSFLVQLLKAELSGSYPTALLAQLSSAEQYQEYLKSLYYAGQKLKVEIPDPYRSDPVIDILRSSLAGDDRELGTHGAYVTHPSCLPLIKYLYLQRMKSRDPEHCQILEEELETLNYIPYTPAG